MPGGEYHMYNPPVVQALQAAVRGDDAEAYARYADLVNGRPPTALRDLLRLNTSATPIPLDEVEPVESILRRFHSSGLSLGALDRKSARSGQIVSGRVDR